MNFFNFKRGHWVLVTGFLSAVILAVAVFAYLTQRQARTMRAEFRESLIPGPFKVSDDELEKNAVTGHDDGLSSPGARTAHSDGACRSCTEKKKTAMPQGNAESVDPAE